MPEEGLKEIKNLLENIFVFEAKFKEELLVKASSLSDVKLDQLKSILKDISIWQKKALENKIKEDPGFFKKVASARQKLDQEIMDLYKQKLNEEDRKKTEIILNKISSI